MPIDYEAEYNNRARVPEHPEIFTRWRMAAGEFRTTMTAEGHAELGLPYGASKREIVDLFHAGSAEDPSVALFIHGGYWRALEPESFSHVARGLHARQITVALAGYDLCPAVSVSAIVAETRKACLYLWERFSKRLTVFGHSAGGHLAACLLATDWTTLDPTAPHDLVPCAYSISGLFDLNPMLHTSMNADLKLDAAQAHEMSPVHWPVAPGRVLDAVVGGAESSEFLRQSHLIVEEWAKKGVQTRYEEIPGANHFTVLDPLQDPDSGMVNRLVELCERNQQAR